MPTIQTVLSSSIPDEQPTTLPDTNIIVSTRLRQTDKRLLRRIHSANSIIPIQEKSSHFFIKNKNSIRESTEGMNPSSNKQPQIIFRNKNGQFASPPDGSKSTKTVKIFRHIIFI